MGTDRIQAGVAMGLYLLVVIGIGVYFARRANRSTRDYFLGGRSLGALGQRDERGSFRSVAALFILIFFTVYAASCFVTLGKLFSTVFGTSYNSLIFGAAVPYGLITIISTVSWGLGYFGMPLVLLRFMAIRKASDLRLSRRVATISSSDSYLLIASSAIAKNLYQHVFRRQASDRQVLKGSKIVLLAVTVVAILLALDENSVIFRIVSFAWAGFGATFGPVMLFSVFSRRTTRAGALAGMIAGGGMIFIWKLLIRPLGGIWNLYELGPAFLFSCLMILLVSRLTQQDQTVATQHEQYLQELAKAD